MGACNIPLERYIARSHFPIILVVKSKKQICNRLVTADQADKKRTTTDFGRGFHWHGIFKLMMTLTVKLSVIRVT